MKRIGKENVNQKGKKVILSIIKNFSGFVIPYLEGISRFKISEKGSKSHEKFVEKLWIFREK